MSTQFPVGAKPFATSSHLYAYDLGTNDFYYIDEDLYCALQHPAEKLSHAAEQQLHDAQARGIFSAVAPADMGYPLEGDDLANALAHELGALILEVTQNCNFRCSYCSFSGQYRYNRTHRKSSMTWEVARRAVEHYLRACQMPTIGFFGGEPLLNFGLIRRVIEYADSIAAGPVTYTLTTNGSLLVPALIDYFAAHNVTVNISLDGPESNHDQFRRTAGGQRTWIRIMKNIRRANSSHPEWFRQSVHFMMLATPPYHLELFETFIKANRDIFVSPQMIVFSFVNTLDLENTNSLSRQDGKKDELARLRSQYRDALVEGRREELTLECSLFDKMMFKLHHRTLAAHPDRPLPPNGSCIPALRRLYVDTQGTMHLCERINPTIPIGSVGSGIDANSVQRHMDTFAELTKLECLRCWASRFCPICPAHVAGFGNYDRAKKLDLCERVRQDLVNDFVLYNEIMDRNPNAFDFMDEYFML